MRKITLSLLALFVTCFMWQSNAQYTVDQSGTYNPIDISATETFVTLTDDSATGLLPIGFTFNFYGNDYTEFYIASNGYVLFDNTGATSGASSRDPEFLPDASNPSNLIAPAWSDLNPGAGGQISYTTVGTAPNRILVVRFESVPHFFSSATITSQVQLYEGSNNIEIHSEDIQTDGGDMTQGIESAGGVEGVAPAGRNETSWSATNDYVAFMPPMFIGNPPVISCPMDIMSDTDPGECGAIINFADAIAVDVEDGILTTTQTAGPASGTQFPTGDTMVEFSVTDSDDNTVTCSFMVTVTDNEAPMAVCQDLTLEVDSMSGTVSITADDIDNGSSDNCTIDSMTLSQTTFGCSDIGDNTVTLTVTDDSGNVTTCEATVTIEDNTAPDITCIGQPGTVTVSEDFDSGLPGDWSTVVNSGPCDWQNGTDLPTGDDFTTPAMLFNDDGCGSAAAASNVSLVSAVYDLTGSASASITYDVAFQEAAGGENFTVEVWDGSAWQEIAFYDADLDPDIQTETFDVLSFANADFQVRWTYDDNGAWGWHAGVDNFQLDYDVPASPLELELDAMGMATIPADDLILSANEACGYVVTVGGPNTGGGTPQSLTTNLVSNNGFNGNWFDMTATNDVTITSFDVNLATGVNDDVEVYYKTGTYAGFESDPSAWTLLGSANVTSNGTDVATPLDLGAELFVGAGETVAFHITTVNGSTMNYINGTTEGALWASDANIEVFEGAGGSGPFGTSIFAPRNFSGVIQYIEGTPIDNEISFDCSQLGENQIEVFVTDSSGNFSSCIATVNVMDVTDPVLVCADATIELGEDGTAEVDPMALLANAPSTFEAMVIGSDNGSGTEGFTDFTVNVTEAASISFDWDYTANDAAGFDGFGYVLNGTYTELTDPTVGNQSGSASVSVEAGDVFGFRSQTDDNTFGNNEAVVSNFMPGFNGQFAPANWTLELTNSDGDAFFVEIPGGPLSFDACGIDVMAVDVNEVTCADIGTPIEVTVFASDSSGNTASCTSMVTVVDTLGPVVTCPEDQTVDPGQNELFYEVPDYFATGEATATDNCTDPVSIFSQDPAAGELVPDGTYTVTLTATDEYGNESSCSFELTVESVLGVDNNDLGASIAMYPNPADTKVTIAAQNNISLQSAVIYDINGRMVNEINLVGMQGEKVIDISALASGVYAVKLNAENGTAVKRLIKE